MASPLTTRELIVAQREALARARAVEGPFGHSVAAHEALLKRLMEELRAASPSTAAALAGFELATRLADVAAPGGPRSLLKAFHTETLRPQAEFNRALVEVMRVVLQSTPSDPAWISQRLGALADPTAWRVKSHRSNAAGQLVDLTKKAYLRAAGPVLQRVLARQREWNLKAIALLEQVGRDPARATALLGELAAPQSKGDDRVLSATAFVWRELLERQAAFNRHVVGLLAGAVSRSEPTYPEWAAARERERLEALGERPPSATTFAVLVLANTAEGIAETVRSLEAQRSDHWTLTVVGQPGLSAAAEKRLSALPFTRAAKPGLAAALAASKVRADWVTFLAPGDRLAPHALAEVAAHAARAPEAALIFADEDRLDAEGKRADPWFKPQLSAALLASCDCLERGLFVRLSRAKALLADGSASELGWRALERKTPVSHLAEVLVTRPGGARRRADDFVSKEGKAALERHLQRTGVDAKVTLSKGRIRVRHTRAGKPLVSIIVPFKDKPELLRTLIRSLEEHTRHQHFELILVSNQSVEPETRALLDGLTDPRIRVLAWDHPFHYPKLNNFGAREAKGELLLFLNNDIEAYEPGWLDELVSQAQQTEVGAVGAKLLFPDRTLQHAGVVVGMGGFAGHVFAGLPDDGRWTPFGTADWGRDVLAVTSACVMLRRALFEELHGFDERFVVCGSDVDLCLRVRERGLRVVYAPEAVLLHHESASRGGAPIPVGDFWESFRSYLPFLSGDPFYSPHLSLASTAPGLRPADEPPALDTALQFLAGEEGLLAPEGRAAETRRVQGLVRTLDYGAKELSAPVPAGRARAPSRLTWFLPYFDQPFGGVHTVLRFADLWRREHRVENRFVIYDHPHVTARELEAKVASLFPEQPGQFEVLKSPEAVSRLAECDVGLATSWSSAYFLLRHPRARTRAYFVQDYEPAFFPAGTQSALAANTYQLGFFGLFNSRGLHDAVTAAHPMEGAWFEPSVDHALFHPHGRTATGSPVRVFFYGRPSIDRNGFELGLEALRLLKQRFGARVEIVSAGELFDPRTYGAADVLQNLGLLPYAQTPELYRRTDVGLALMFTRHPSYLPLELMACGVTVVSNDNPANRWLFEHAENSLLAQPTASCLAEQLIAAVGDAKLREKLGSAGARRLLATTWEAEAEKTWAVLCRYCAKSLARDAAS